MSVVENPRVQGLEVSMNQGPPVQVHTKLGILFGVYRDYTGYIAKYPSSTLLPFLFWVRVSLLKLNMGKRVPLLRVYWGNPDLRKSSSLGGPPFSNRVSEG